MLERRSEISPAGLAETRGVVFTDFHPFSPSALLGEVLGKRDFGVGVRLTKTLDGSIIAEVYCQTGKDKEIFEKLRLTREFRVLERAFSLQTPVESLKEADYSDDQVFPDYYVASLERDVQRCHNWSDETKKRVMAYFWGNKSKDCYGNYLLLQEEAEILRLEKKTEIADKTEVIAKRMSDLATVCKNKERAILFPDPKSKPEERLQPLTSKDVAKLLEEVVNRHLPRI